MGTYKSNLYKMGKTDKKYTLEGQFEVFLEKIGGVHQDDKEGLRGVFYASVIQTLVFFEEVVDELSDSVMNDLVKDGVEYLSKTGGRK